jgi:SAM-dependent methyltransferase
MAIDVNYARFLVSSRQNGVNFGHTLTLGRLNFYLGTKETRRLLQWGGMDPGQHPRLMDFQASRYSEPFFEALGAQAVDSMDASNFEGATIIHDLNLPVPEALKGRFDVVCDGGTIEHILNFPMVIRNCLEMVKLGGHFVLATPANNFFGHGFYQFSPELWFRLLSDLNGFEMRRMVALEYKPRARWFEVANPEAVRDRVILTNRYPVLLMALARKTAEKPVLQTFPAQSDYVPRWGGGGDPANRRRALEQKLRRLFLETMPSLARFLENYYCCSWFNRRQSLRNRRFFRPVKR